MRNPDTVKDRDKTKPVLVLIPTTGQRYSGAANFLGKLDKVVIAGSPDLPHEELLKEAAKRKRYIATVLLWNAHTTRNARAARLALEKLYGPVVAKAWSQPPADIAEQAARWNLPQEMSTHMKRAKFVLWHNWREKRFVPALYCPDVVTALYALAALRELRACPACDKPFIPIREDQEYCSIPCRERFRQQRRREKLSIKGVKT